MVQDKPTGTCLATVLLDRLFLSFVGSVYDYMRSGLRHRKEDKEVEAYWGMMVLLALGECRSRDDRIVCHTS